MTTLTVAYTDTIFPAGTGALAAISATLTGTASAAPVSLSIPPGTQSVTVTLLPDTYAYSIQNQDAQGNNLDGPFTGSFTITAPAQVTLSLASGLSVAA
jgi:hypothetical protein